MPAETRNGIKTDKSKQIASKVSKLLAEENCTVAEANEILSIVAKQIANSPVTVQ